MQFCAGDRNGNSVSMVNSIYTNFGSGIVPEGLGFVLQNRGCNFTFVADLPHLHWPQQRRDQTIIPCLTPNPDGYLHVVPGVMGGFMQPQARAISQCHVLEEGLDPQAALDRSASREPRRSFSLEEGMSEETVAAKPPWVIPRL